MTRLSLFVVFGLVTAALAQNCGPSYGDQICAAGNCCSQYGWCDTSAAHCDSANCQKEYSGAGSSCAGSGTSPTTASSSPTASGGPYPSTVPSIDVCGPQHGVSCPGAGSGGFFYRCCSVNGHCGPKNGEQAQTDYCGGGCQPGYGVCDSRPVPASPPPPAGVAHEGDNCGPIVNKKCAAGLCCSGSNFCGAGVDFCGAANWCQVNWGDCHK